MIAVERPTEIICAGEGLVEAVRVCSEHGCTTHEMRCGRGERECMRHHLEHHTITMGELEKRLATDPVLPQHYAIVEKAINGAIDRWITELK